MNGAGSDGERPSHAGVSRGSANCGRRTPLSFTVGVNQAPARRDGGSRPCRRRSGSARLGAHGARPYPRRSHPDSGCSARSVTAAPSSRAASDSPRPALCHSHGVSREAHLSAQCSPPIQEARLPCPDEYPSGSRRPQVASRQGARPPVGLTGRIRTRETFVRLRREGHRVRIEPFWCTHLIEPTSTTVDLAFAINRTVGNAVTRNRLRRRLRAILVELPLPPGSYLVGCRPAAAELTYDQVRRKLAQLPAKIDASTGRVRAGSDRH